MTKDALFLEGNLPTGTRLTVRTGLPEGYWRLLNRGVPLGKSTTAQVDEACGSLEAYSEVDKALAELNGNTTAFLLSESYAFLEGMNQQMESAMLYGDISNNPAGICGLAPRFSDWSAPSGQMLVDGKGRRPAANTSIWFIEWGAQTVFGIYPKGSKAGLYHNFLGEQTLFDENGGRYQGYRTHYMWKIGLAVKDWRYVARIPNIDVESLEDAGTVNYAGPELLNMLIDAYNKMGPKRKGNRIIYCNRQIKTALDKMVMNKNNVSLSLQTFAGEPVLSFWGVPIRQCDVILNTEDPVI